MRGTSLNQQTSIVDGTQNVPHTETPSHFEYKSLKVELTKTCSDYWDDPPNVTRGYSTI